MSINWIRHFELILTNDSGAGISLSDFRVTFSIDWYNISWPRVATFRIYNLGQNTSNRILGTEFTKLKLIAGYDGVAPAVDSSQLNQAQQISASDVGQVNGQNYGEIFSGEIRFTLTGRENPTDTYVAIQAIDGHNAWNNATINQTVAAGYTVSDIHSQAMSNLSPFGINAGITPDMPATVFPRGRVMYGMTRNVLHNIAGQCDATWQFVDGQVDIVPNDKYTQEAIVLNSKTGLIGMPQQTMGAGVNVKCLINPNIRLNGLIQLDQASVYRKELSSSDIQSSGGRITETNDNGTLSVTGIASSSPPASIATDGVYVVRGISYTGDTRGQSWYMEMMCEARGAKDLATQSAIQRGA